jgi:UDP-N-acetylmuramate dehydrogenase
MSWRTPANLAWLAGLPGVEPDRPLARLTSFNIGGPADFLVAGERPEELVEECHRRGVPYLLLGAGTNLLVADAGVEGLVVRCVNRGWKVEGRRVYAEAGLKMLRLARICADHDLVGMEWAIGVPGTVGGAVYQNAGCWGGELADVLAAADGFCPGIGRRRWSPADLGLRYRTSALREGALRRALVTGALIELRPGDGAEGRRRMARWTEERTRTQPIRTKNCGSVFRNPAGDSAGRLIEAAGLKGAREGAAEISMQHANFIVNHGGATAADVDRLVHRAQAEVRQRFGVRLEPEVELVGRWSAQSSEGEAG